MFRLGFLAAVFLGFAVAGCGDSEGTPTPPVEEWCDLERPRENCELRSAAIRSQDDMAELCQSTCTNIGSLNLVGLDLEVLKGLKGFSDIGILTMSSMPDDVRDLQALGDIKTVNILQIRSNGALESLRGIEEVAFEKRCPECDRLIEIQYNSNLSSLDGLQNVPEVETVVIDGNAKLEVVDGFESLKHAGIGIYGNERLRRISGFQSLETSPGLSISINQNLERIDAFPNLTQLDSLQLDRNRKLNLCDVDRVLGQLDQAPDFVSITESGTPCSD